MTDLLRIGAGVGSLVFALVALIDVFRGRIDRSTLNVIAAGVWLLVSQGSGR